MSRMFLLAGVAALAIAMPVAAEKGGKGGGHGNGGGQAAQTESHGGGHGNGHGKGGGQSVQVESHGGGHRNRGAGQGARHVEIERHAAQARGPERREARRAVVRQERALRGRDRVEDRRAAFERRGRGFDDNGGDRLRFRDDARRFAGAGRGCPPGLAKKHNGCLPPGQAKKMFGLGDRLEPAWFGGLALPAGYRDFYYDTPAYTYRYDEAGYIYRVDSGTNMVSSLIPLLGGGFAVGQPLPAGYDAYNVPLDYRDRYADDDDYLYRYSDGNIYQVDAKTQVIQAIVEMLV